MGAVSRVRGGGHTVSAWAIVPVWALRTDSSAEASHRVSRGLWDGEGGGAPCLIVGHRNNDGGGDSIKGTAWGGDEVDVIQDQPFQGVD